MSGSMRSTRARRAAAREAPSIGRARQHAGFRWSDAERGQSGGFPTNRLHSRTRRRRTWRDARARLRRRRSRSLYRTHVIQSHPSEHDAPDTFPSSRWRASYGPSLSRPRHFEREDGDLRTSDPSNHDRTSATTRSATVMAPLSAPIRRSTVSASGAFTSRESSDSRAAGSA